MNRDLNLNSVRERAEPWDFIVIGGGATGAGCALDAATRGFSVLLLEQHDFGKGTSSRSTKLVHGGVRYLRQGNVSLVRESLRERGLLLQNAPHVVHKQEFIIPCYGLWEKIFYGLGMKIYDLLAGKLSFGRSRVINRGEVLERLRNIDSQDRSGGVLYYDGQFDDTRLLIDILRTASAHGAAVLNYARVVGLRKSESGRIDGLDFEDIENGTRYSISAKAVINATGAFCCAIQEMSDANSKPVLAYSQGVHLVFDRKFLPRETALMIPKTSDGRVLFCIPWLDHVLVGTTDTPVELPELEPRALEQEVEFILETASGYLTSKPERTDILSVFAGVRPLIKRGNAVTSSLSRSHELFVDGSGLVTITGGKWTTFRQMAENAVDRAAEEAGLEKGRCVTASLPIDPPETVESAEPIHPKIKLTRSEVFRAVHDEMARTVEDVLARRSRALFLDAAAAIELAPAVAEIMAVELGRDDQWIVKQIDNFHSVAKSYTI
ncbi:MAG TPA: glycerol-3-phosphate dehydrogenase/oxidase [Pyrinomonadaceae bacterium]|nr:glycerol-3-phosphate dehydrogenase/oxidase [Pyrinomonadaceae bacterium]